MRWPAWQPPAFSPLPGSALARAVTAEWQRDDPRPQLASMLRTTFGAYVVHLTSSGTAALEVAIRLARVRAGGGAVALPAYGCFDIATAAVGAGARIALYDVDPRTLGPDLDSLIGVLNAGARIVVVAPIAGVPVDWDAVAGCAARFGAVLVEDAAQGHGARWRDRPLGALGSIGVLSFGRGKGWTGGRGGAVLVRDPVLAEYSRGLTLRDAGVGDEFTVLASALGQAVFGHPSRYTVPARLPWLHLGETRYREPAPLAGLSRATAALLMSSSFAANQEAQRRRGNAAAFLELLEARRSDVSLIAVPAQATPGYLRLPVRIPAAYGGRACASAMERFGVAAGYPSTLAALPAVRDRLYAAGSWTGAATLVRELITLPTHRWTSASGRRAIVDVIRGTMAEASASLSASPHQTAARSV